jgi:hypothetical protein
MDRGQGGGRMQRGVQPGCLVWGSSSSGSCVFESEGGSLQEVWVREPEQGSFLMRGKQGQREGVNR